MGVSNKAVSKWETGEGLPNYEAMLALSSLYGITINEILAGERQKDEATPSPIRDTASPSGGYYALTIISLIFFSFAILAMTIFNFLHQGITGGIVSLCLFAVGAVSYGSSFSFRTKSQGLITANNVLGLLAFGQAAMGTTLFGFLQFNANFYLDYFTWFIETLFVTVPVAIAVGILGKKAMDQGLSFKGFLARYGNVASAFFLLGIAIFALIVFLMSLPEVSSHSAFFIILILIFLSALIFGALSLKHPLLAMIGNYVLLALSILYLVASSSGRYYEGQAIFLYGVDAALLVLYCLPVSIFSTIGYVQGKKGCGK